MPEINKTLIVNTTTTDKQNLSDEYVQALPSFAFDDNDALLDMGYWYLNKMCHMSMRDIGVQLHLSARSVKYHIDKFNKRYNDDDNHDDDVEQMRQELTNRQIQAIASQVNLSNGDAADRVDADVELKHIQSLEKAGNEQARSIAVSLQLITYDSYVSLFGKQPYFEQRPGCPDVWYQCFAEAFDYDASNYARALSGDYQVHFEFFDQLIKYMQDAMTNTQRKSIKIAVALHNLDTKELRDIINDDLNPHYRRLFAQKDDDGDIHLFLKSRDNPDVVTDISGERYTLHNGEVNGLDTISPFDVLDINEKTLAIRPIDVCYDGSRVSLYRWKMPHIHLTAWAPSGISIRRWGKMMGLINPEDLHFIDKLQGKHKNSADGARFSFNAMIGYLAHMTVQARMDGKHEYTDWGVRVRHSSTVDMKSIMTSNIEKYDQQLMEDLNHVDIPGLVDMCINGELDINTVYDPRSILSRRLADTRGTASNHVRSTFLNEYNKAKWASNPGIEEVLYVWGDLGGIGKTVVAREELAPGVDPDDTSRHDIIVAKSGSKSGTGGAVEDYVAEPCILFDDCRPTSIGSSFGSVDNLLKFFDPSRKDVMSLKARNADTLVSATKFAFTNTTDPYDFFTYVKNRSREVGSDSQWLRRLSSLMYVSASKTKSGYAVVRHLSHMATFTAETFRSMYLFDRRHNTRVNLSRSHYLFCQWVANHVVRTPVYDEGFSVGDRLLEALRKHSGHSFTIDDDLTFHINVDDVLEGRCNFADILPSPCDDDDCYYCKHRRLSVRQLLDIEYPSDFDFSDDYDRFFYRAQRGRNNGLDTWHHINPRSKIDHTVRFEDGNYCRWLLTMLQSPDYELYGVFDGVKRRICIDPARLHVGDVYVHLLADNDLEAWGGTYADYQWCSDDYNNKYSYNNYLRVKDEVEKAVAGAKPNETPLAYVLNSFGFICDEKWEQHSACDNPDYHDRVKRLNDEKLSD